MNFTTLRTRSIVAAMLAMGGLAAAVTPAAAQSRSGGSTYQQELAVCGHNQQDRAACIREAGAARQAAARGNLTSAPDYRANAVARCERHPPADRADCEARVLGDRGNIDASIDGSVMGGGVIRESVSTTVIVPAAAPAVRPAPGAVIVAPVERMPAPAPMPRMAPAR